MKNLSPSNRDIYILGSMYVVLAMLQNVTNSDVWRELLGKTVIAVIGTVVVGLLAWRAYIDKTVARGKIADEAESYPVPVTVENAPTDPIPTTDTPPSNSTTNVMPTTGTATTTEEVI